jgi:hypothetical protein
MYPDSPFAYPQSSYQRPVALVLVDPDVDPNFTVCFRSEWLPYVIGALSQLLAQTTWQTDDPDALNLVQARAQLLIALFMEGCPTIMPDAGCVTYPPSASFISYYPQNPYTQPGYVPDWYSIAPFVLVDSELAAVFTGMQIGDVLALNGAFPNPDAVVEHGLSAIHLEFMGEGTVELEFVSIFAGALVGVTVDDDGLHTVFVDTNADVLAAPPETPGAFIETFTITGTGTHHIDIRFWPVLDDSGIPLRYGGGLRSVRLCGPGTE